jgi:hypothetical protein
MKRAPLFLFVTIIAQGCAGYRLTWAKGNGGGTGKYIDSGATKLQDHSCPREAHYQVISGKDANGSFRYVSKGSYPGLSHH